MVGMSQDKSVTEVGSATPAYLDQSAWRQLQDAASLEQFVVQWLAMLCTMLDGVKSGLVMTASDEQNAYQTSASWAPDKQQSQALISVVELAIQESRGILKDTAANRNKVEHLRICYLAYPVLIDKQLHGAVGLEATVSGDLDTRKLMRQLQWGIAWIEVWERRNRALTYSPANNKAEMALEVLISSLEHEDFQAASTAAATELAILTQCDKVSIGFSDNKQIRVKALSHSAQFSSKSNLISAIGLAMDEAAEYRETVFYPVRSEKEHKTFYAHEKLSKELDNHQSICTVPLCSDQKIFGGITFERSLDKPFDNDTVAVLELVAALLGPVLEGKRREERSLLKKTMDAFSIKLQRLFGAGYVGTKLSAIALVAIILFFCFAQKTYFISADTHIEGAIQRVIAAPMQGYISAAYVRAGDIVKKGQLLYTLDDRDLLLERLKWETQKDQHLKQYRTALANNERAQMRIFGAQLRQAEAQLKLLDEQLARTQVMAPFDAVVVSGDLSQSLRAPVDKGDILFELAPLNAYRVIMDVDEADIIDVKPQLTGKLVLTGESKEILPIVVEKITPVSETREGLNFFRVESKLTKIPQFLRPGMKGVGKIEIGQRKIIWIWTHRFVDWWRLWWWKWIP